MNLLLIVPGLAFVILQGLGLDRSITQALIVAQAQVIQDLLFWNLLIHYRDFLPTNSFESTGNHMSLEHSNWIGSSYINGR
jgi:hypothetical protein